MSANRCTICANADLRRLVELGWNDKMSSVDISHAFGGVPTWQTVKRHINEHSINDRTRRELPTEAVTSTRARIEMLQKKMLDEIESRIQWAEERASTARDNGNAEAVAADWFDVLNPKVQASIASVIKMQDQTDKREGKKASVAVDLMKLMGGTPPPSHLIEDGATVAGEYEEVDDTPAE